MTQNNILKDDFSTLLCRAVDAGNLQKTEELLVKYPSLADLSDPKINEQGYLFSIAIKKSPKLLKLLIDTYVATKLLGDEHSIEYLCYKQKLGTMLEYQIDKSSLEFSDLPQEIQKILAPWMPQYSDSEDEQDLTGFEIDLSFSDYEGSHYHNDTHHLHHNSSNSSLIGEAH